MFLDVCIVNKEQPKIESISGWGLEVVFNRGAQIWPQNDDIECDYSSDYTDVFQCRFAKADKSAISQDESVALLTELNKLGHKWVQVHLFEV